jgi:CubicO group peptidase (beta-lactamase class C family)
MFGPLKMKEVWFYPPESTFSRIPGVYDKPGILEKVTSEWAAGTGLVGGLFTYGKNKVYFNPSGGLHGTTYDYYRFTQMMLNKGTLDGVRVLSRQAVEIMTTVQVGEGMRTYINSNNRWGYGLDIQDDVNMRPLRDWYGGKGSYGWRGFFSTMWFVNPVNDTVVITMTQTPRNAYPWGVKVNIAAGSAVMN